MRQAYDYWQDQPGFCVPSAVDRGLQQPCQSQKASAQRVRIEQTRHKYRDKSTNVWLTLSKAKQAAKLSKSKLQQPILAWKAGTNAADFTKPKFTQQVQTHKPEPNAKRCKQPYTQHPFSNLQAPPTAVVARVHTSQQQLKGSFTRPVDLRSSFAAPVNLRMQFVRPVAIGRQLRNPASGSSFAPEAAVLPRSVFLERPAKPCVDLLSHIVNPRNRGKLRFSAERNIEFSKRGKNSDFRDPGKSEIPNLALVCSLAFSGVFRSAIFRENEKKRVFL